MAMAALKSPERLIDRLPPVRGTYEENAALARFTWFRVGGPAEILFEPADRDDLQDFLASGHGGAPVTMIGFGSNLLVRDGGVPGVVVRLGDAFAKIEIEDRGLRAGAAALSINIARAAADRSLAGLEFLSGIPGTIGGALRMNAGAYGSETADVLHRATALDGNGDMHEAVPGDLGFSYRHCEAPEDWIFVAAELDTVPGDGDEIASRMAEIAAQRTESQPRTRTGGSTFTNPVGHKAWELIEAAGCRGLRRGGAMVSDLHCNFLINTGEATAADFEELGEVLRRRVKEASGIELDWEIRRIGIATEGAS